MLRYGYLLLSLLFFACGGETETVEMPVINERDPGIARLSEAIRARPTAEVYAQRAAMYYEQDNYDDAIADLTQALALDSTNVDYHYGLADVYLDYYRSRLALRTLEAAAELDPDRLETQLRLAETQLILKQYDDALASLNQAVRIDSRNPEAYYLLSQVFAETGDTARAVNAAEEATQIDPDMTDAFLLLGEIATKRGDARAQDYYRTAMSIDPTDPVARHALGDYYRDAGDLPRAIAEYRSLMTVDRQYVAGNFNAGLLLMELDSLPQAYDEFNITIKNDPIHIRAYFYRGYASELMGDTAAARSDYKRALRMAPDFTLAQTALARLNASG